MIRGSVYNDCLVVTFSLAAMTTRSTCGRLSSSVRSACVQTGSYGEKKKKGGGGFTVYQGNSPSFLIQIAAAPVTLALARAVNAF